ncbi:MAG: hypothetical protein Q8N44_23095 [Rubrivivax sp.]|nr:hypothetical protein [Rubrivivax sp.]
MSIDARFAVVCVAAAALLSPPVMATPPANAPPGTICVTPAGWCHAVKPGPPGAPCACQGPNGWVQGRLR